MLSVHRYHEISESTQSILNPVSLDLGCGQGEMLCRFASRFGTTGVGVDIHPPLIEQAKERARTLGVKHAVEFQLGEGAAFDPTSGTFDIVASIGTSWNRGGLVGTLDMMLAVAADDAQAQNV